ncbi:Uncharacterised protein [Serratia fonticola]|uniref:Uncharacterized protein n=1 Tax=Serratia fonticola TaxID=47917 RepID=A0A4U9TLZ6_SERFO|nr:Uncharacterised protein [Serratia fonticola]
MAYVAQKAVTSTAQAERKAGGQGSFRVGLTQPRCVFSNLRKLAAQANPRRRWNSMGYVNVDINMQFTLAVDQIGLAADKHDAVLVGISMGCADLHAL